jgi:hypothetical protein
MSHMQNCPYCGADTRLNKYSKHIGNMTDHIITRSHPAKEVRKQRILEGAASVVLALSLCAALIMVGVVAMTALYPHNYHSEQGR